jgi:hypothetical protein
MSFKMGYPVQQKAGIVIVARVEAQCCECQKLAGQNITILIPIPAIF